MRGSTVRGATVMPIDCRHCKNRQANGRRGLCSACYGCESIRDQYESGKQPPKPGHKACRHCSKGNVNRPRGLCWTCYYTPGVKDLYQPTSKYAQRGVGNLTGAQPLPEPTDARPGTPEKLAVLIARAGRGEQLHHPNDPRMEKSLRRGTGVITGKVIDAPIDLGWMDDGIGFVFGGEGGLDRVSFGVPLRSYGGVE